MDQLPLGIAFEPPGAAWLHAALAGLSQAVVAFTLVLTRVSGMAIVGPVFGHPDVPIQTRALLVAALSLVISPALLTADSTRAFDLLDRNRDGWLALGEVAPPLRPHLAELLAQAGKSGDEELTADEFHLGVPVPRTPLDFAWLALVEFAVGAALGLGVLAVLSGLQMAGNLIDQQVGVSLGEVFNPEFEINASLSGQLLHQLGLVVFLIIGGHLLMVSALVDTFTALPVGYAWVSPPAVDVLRDLVFQSLVVAVRVSAPIMAVMAVVGLAMGILGHTIPQINILVLGFPVRTLTGLVVLGLALGGVAQVMAGALSEAISRLREVLIGL